ncbi:hypothetical protein ANN_19132 [Periplaneta americana]|uniref:Uncharacterized protein n=1 Tax=Periplaneta americana TaxID=6978 RepID=A0ABQ8S913_PERAM|nr:hypothetical protein ANN_19132 [Periplaneta americana]
MDPHGYHRAHATGHIKIPLAFRYRKKSPLAMSSTLRHVHLFWTLRDLSHTEIDSHHRLGSSLPSQYLSREQQFPLLLDGSHPFVQLLIRETHIRLHHLGLRIVLSELCSQFWILRARQAVRRYYAPVFPAKMAHNHLGQAIEAPLPGDRLTPLKPFEVTGIDFAGPLYVKWSEGHTRNAT